MERNETGTKPTSKLLKSNNLAAFPVAGGGRSGPPRAGGEDSLPGAGGLPDLRWEKKHPSRAKPLRRHQLLLQHGPDQHARPKVRQQRYQFGHFVAISVSFMWTIRLD